MYCKLLAASKTRFKFITTLKISMINEKPSLSNYISILGWGSTKILTNGALDVANKNYDISDTLQEIKVPLLPWSLCKDTYSITHEEFAKKNDKVFCAGAIGTKKRHKQGGCIGDSGSPLICDSPKGKVISGIMLGGNPNCLPGQNYMVFTDVAKHKQWIIQTIR